MFKKFKTKLVKKRHIAFFIPTLGGGGAERVILNLSKGFSQKGYYVDLVLVNAKGEYLDQLPSEIRVIDLKAKRTLFSLPKLVYYIVRERPIILFSALTHANIIALWAKQLACVPVRVIISQHGMLSSLSRNNSCWWYNYLLRSIKTFYPLADKIIAVSHGVADDLIKLGISPRQIEVIYNPIVDRTLFEKAEEAVNHPWFKPGEPPVILSVGRLVKEKDYPTLIRAFALLQPSKVPVRFMILGEGEERPYLEMLAQEFGVDKYIIMPGFVKNPYKYMKRSKVVVLSSCQEGFGNVLVEAMALGINVVSTNCPGPRKILLNGRYGKLVPIGDPIALSNAILETLKNPVEKDLLKKRAHFFCIENILQQYIHSIFEKEI